jgi:hypothetical protein
VLHDLQGLGSLTTIWRPFGDTWDIYYVGLAPEHSRSRAMIYDTAFDAVFGVVPTPYVLTPAALLFACFLLSFVQRLVF